MSYKIILHPGARKELLEAWIWYEDKQFGLGNRFENEVYNHIEEIQQNPDRYSVRKKNSAKQKSKYFLT
jgi:hypothetical protein